METQKIKRQITIVILGILSALVLEGGFAVYRAGRGFGTDSEKVFFNPEMYQDYMVSGENNEIWNISGPDPWLAVYSEDEIGHFCITFKEPLAQETGVLFYYAQNGEFDRYQRKDWYMLPGTKTAQFSVPCGNWNSFRLTIAGNFILEKLEAVKAVPLSQLSFLQAVRQINGIRLAVLSILLSMSGVLLTEKEKKAWTFPDCLSGCHPYFGSFSGYCCPCNCSYGGTICLFRKKGACRSVLCVYVFFYQLQSPVFSVKRSIAFAQQGRKLLCVYPKTVNYRCFAAPSLWCVLCPPALYFLCFRPRLDTILSKGND